MVGESPKPRRQHAGQPRNIDAEAEIEAAQQPRVDAERRNGFEIARAGADAHAEPCEAEHGEQRRHRHRDDHHHEHAVTGKEEISLDSGFINHIGG